MAGPSLMKSQMDTAKPILKFGRQKFAAIKLFFLVKVCFWQPMLTEQLFLHMMLQHATIKLLIFSISDGLIIRATPLISKTIKTSAENFVCSYLSISFCCPPNASTVFRELNTSSATKPA